MRRIRKTANRLCFLATLCVVVGCACPPNGYYSGMRTGYVSNRVVYDQACAPAGCDPCDPVDTCGTIEYSRNPCEPQSCAPQIFAPRTYAPRVVDYRKSFSNLGNGVLLFSRGILDIAAAPFVVAGNLLSSGCQYEVLTFCDDNVSVGRTYYQSVDPCAPDCSSGCDPCSNGYTEGIQYSNSVSSLGTTMLAPPRRNSAVIQASYEEPTAPVRFVQPR